MKQENTCVDIDGTASRSLTAGGDADLWETGTPLGWIVAFGSRAARVGDEETLLRIIGEEAIRVAGVADVALYAGPGTGHPIHLVRAGGAVGGGTFPRQLPRGAAICGSEAEEGFRWFPAPAGLPGDGSGGASARLAMRGRDDRLEVLVFRWLPEKPPGACERNALLGLATCAGMGWRTLRSRQEAEAAQAREREAGELRSRLLSMIAHEFRTPLAAVKAAAEILQQHGDRLSGDRRGELLETVQGAAERLATMLEEMLVIGRGEPGRDGFAPVLLDLADLVDSCVNEARLADRQRHQFQVQRPTGSFPVRADPRLLRHILANLLGNAALYSPAGQAVETTVELAAEGWVIRVSDQGRGIPAEDGERVFRPFERGSNVQDLPGTGLGLEIARRMAVQHGADLRFTSVPGRGTTFEIRGRDTPPTGPAPVHEPNSVDRG